ncbi:MAG: heparinase II/III family protein [Planctomycetota bacterium]
MSILSLAIKALRMPPRKLAQKICARLGRWRAQRSERSHDLRLGTWDNEPPPGPFQWRLRELPLPQRNLEELTTVAEVCRRHLDHRYDLLGSGWIRWEHGVVCPGLLGHRFPPGRSMSADTAGTWLAGQVPTSCLANSQALWRLVSPDYRPHDWQLDARSGYRWSATIWHRDIRYGHLLGVDVKLPWELARMQHLPLLAQAYAHARRGDAGGWETADRYAQEIQNQILDFCAANPPRFGVNWACTMDVAIRVANWLLALDVLHAAGAQLNPRFLAAAGSAVRAHGRFIASHLEWDPVARGNHYLADLAGLAWTGAWLPADDETDSWLALAWRELTAETQRLFQADGTYGEASTAYHCLATETVVYGTLAIAGLSAARQARMQVAIPYPHPAATRPSTPPAQSGFPSTHWQTLARAATAIRDFTTPDGGIALIGDDDSGRFIRWRPAYRLISGREAHASYLDLDPRIDSPDQPFPDLDHRDKRAVAGAILAWSSDAELAAWAAIQGTDETVLTVALGDAGLPNSTTHPPPGGSAPNLPLVKADALRTWTTSAVAHRQETNFAATPGSPLTDGLLFRAFPDLGLWIWRSPRLFLAVRCGPSGLPGLTGHAHQDQLAIELHLDGRAVVRDPGSFIYTPVSEERRRYRSRCAHRAPEPTSAVMSDVPLAPFAAIDSDGQCLYAATDGFVGIAGVAPHAICRWLDIGATGIVIRDLIPGSSRVAAVNSVAPALAYGRRSRSGTQPP